MRVFTFAALVGVSACVIAQPHRHAHRHLQHGLAKRAPNVVTDPSVAVETVTVYILNGKPISESDVREGIANGTLIWGDDGNLSTSSASTPTLAPVIEAPSKQEQIPSASSVAPPPMSSAAVSAQQYSQSLQPASATQASSAPSQAAYQPSNQNGGNDDTDGIDKVFPNNTFSCDTFPQGYGAIPINNAGLGGWIGIQTPQSQGSVGYDNIATVPQGSCQGGDCCKPRSFCSYSCPPAYLKASWPATQGNTGQSVGGLECTDAGKLKMGDGSVAQTLCIDGTNAVTVKVQNKLSVADSICRTDYPGTEGETIPITIQPGGTTQIACPDSANYYTWKGKKTSAQYYINPKGVSESDACQWGNGQGNTGNRAPVNLGVGYDSSSPNNLAYIALFQNCPTNCDAKLGFNVELVSDQMDGSCKYRDGQYYNNGKVDPSGCTVGLHKGGTLTVVLSD